MTIKIQSFVAVALLALATPTLAQCPGGQCARHLPPVFAPLPPAKAWYRLTTHPGFYGYGAMTPQGVLVEWHCPIGSADVRPGLPPSAKPEPELAGVSSRVEPMCYLCTDPKLGCSCNTGTGCTVVACHCAAKP